MRVLAWTVALFLKSVTLVAGQSNQRVYAHVKLTIDRNDDRPAILRDAVKLLDFSVAQNLSANVQEFLKEMVVSTNRTILKMEEALQSLQSKRRLADAFTEGKYRVKAMSKLKAKRCMMKRVDVGSVGKALSVGKLSLDEPFIVSNGTSMISAPLRAQWTAHEIAKRMAQSKLKLDYWNPQQARDRRTGNSVESFEPKRISFQQYLSTCFVSKVPGTGTEHCEQTVHADVWGKEAAQRADGEELDPASMIERLSQELVAANTNSTNIYRTLVDTRQSLLEVGKGRQALLALISTLSANHRQHHTSTELAESVWNKLRVGKFSMGPAGSGEQMQIDPSFGHLEGLLFGSRRWLVMSTDEAERVAAKAREALSLSSAFMFFEEKLPELKEEFGLTHYFECDQEAGDVVWIPRNFYRVAVTTSDFLSFHEQVLHDDKEGAEIMANFLTTSLWSPYPPRQTFSVGLCYEANEVGELEMENKVREWLKATLRSGESTNQLAIEIFSLLGYCSGARAALPSTDTICTPELWTKCRNKLIHLASILKKQFPQKMKKVDFEIVPVSQPLAPLAPRPAHEEL